MSAVKISSRYAKSFLDLAIEQNVLEAVYSDFSTVLQALHTSRELRLLIKSPIIKADAKQNVFALIFKGKLSDITFRYLNLIISKGREPHLTAIIEAFIQQYNTLKGIVNVTITSASTLTPEAEAKISAAIKQATGANEIKLEQKTDASLIGGFVIDMGDKVYDASVSHKLSALEKQLINS